MANKILTIIITILLVGKGYSQLPTISVGFVSVTADNKNLSVSIIKTDEIKTGQFIYYRAESTSNVYTEVGRSNSPIFIDTYVNIAQKKYCYKVSYIDNNGKESEMSQPFCSIYLSDNDKNSIKWTPFSKLTNAEDVEYYIDLVNEDGSRSFLTSARTKDLSINIYEIDGLEQEVELHGMARIRIRAIQPTSFKYNNLYYTNHPLSVYSNIYTIIPPPDFYLPTAFTPNGDRKNDEFLATGKGVVEFEMKVFDRWGNIIFESNDINEGWNGMQIDQSTPSLAGNYTYIVRAKNKFDKVVEKVGTVTLIR